MLTFFHGWRPKMGVVTLLLACVLGIGWVRSLLITDDVLVWSYEDADVNGGGQYRLRSHNQILELFHRHSVYLPVQRTRVGSEESPLYFHYAELEFPLTLLSAYLLLGRPRRPSNQSDDAPTARKTSDTP